MTVPVDLQAAIAAAAALATAPASTVGPQEGENSYRWATVNGLSPLRIVLDGEAIELPLTPEVLIDPLKLQVGTRVWVQLFNRRVIILGAANEGTAIPAPPIGAILPFAGTVAPTDYLLCDGSSKLRASYPDLFGVCGTAFGSVDGTHFNLPDLRNRLPMGAGGTYARASTATGSVTLGTANIPAHSHGVSSSVSGTTGSNGDHGHSLSGSVANAGSHGHSLSGSVGSGGNHTHFVENQNSRSDMLASGGSGVAATGGAQSSGAGDHSHSMSGSADSGGDHGHSLSGSAVNTGSHTHTFSGSFTATSDSQGSGTAFTTTGPFLALNYIIRAT